MKRNYTTPSGEKLSGFNFKKSLGQNFLTDETVCEKMAEDIDKETFVIEIGPGAGVLTKHLCERAKSVVAIEIDSRLIPVLEKELSNYDNLKVICADVLKTDLLSVIKENSDGAAKVKICANLPYYITSPIIMNILNRRLPIDSLTVMVQKEAADRLCAETGSRAAGAVTAVVRYYSNPKKLFLVPRTSFTPSPKVDSAVIKLDILKEPPVEVLSEDCFVKTVKAAFLNRRKTLLNTLSNALPIGKEDIKEILKSLCLDENMRGENLTLNELAALSNKIYDFEKR